MSSELDSSLRPRSAPPGSISVIVPCYNEEEVLDDLSERVTAVMEQLAIPYEIILIDDGSSDNTWPMLVQLQAKDPHFKVIRLSRNHGHQLALSAGIDQASADVALIMDADLQDPPELLGEMLAKWREGYSVVYGKRTSREGESVNKRFLAYSFYRILEKMTGIDIPADTGDFRLMDRCALDVLRKMRERQRFIRGMVSWVGFAQTPVFYDRAARAAGETKYPVHKSLLLAIDAIVSFSYAPLRFATKLGATISALSFLYIFIVLLLKFMGRNLPGYTSEMATILLLGGIQLVILGILGEYIGRIYEQAKDRPLYIIDRIHGEPLAKN